MTHNILLRVEDLPRIDDVGYVYDNTKCMGGRGAIVALALFSLGCNCSYFTSIPNNPNAKNYLKFLQDNGVNIMIEYGSTKTLYRTKYHQNMDDLIDLIIKEIEEIQVL